MDKIISLFNKRIMLQGKFVALGVPNPYINVSPSALTYEYSSGLTDSFNILSNTSYIITTGASWIGVNYNSGFGNLTVTVEMLSENSGFTSRQGTITIENTEYALIKTVTITQNYDVQPILYIMTQGGTFVGDLV